MTSKHESGFSLIEVMIALSILLIVALGLLPLGVVATSQTENQGHLAARVTEYAQDKLEQLMVLTYGDTISDTRVFPAADTGGSGLTVGGSADPAAPVNPYVDYLDINGTLVPAGAGGAAPANWFYKRCWSVTQAAPNLKQITVTAIVSSQVGRFGRIPQATVISLKSSPF
jgi:prepilin-type N-terminal cleavage/methylation domain-containing protein